MPHDVFISHSSKNKGIAETICKALESGSIRCWMAPCNINPGEVWAASVTEAIKSSQLMVLIYSSELGTTQLFF